MTETSNENTATVTSSLRDLQYVAGLVTVIVLLYVRTFNVPWYYDDIMNIVERPYFNDFDQIMRLIFSSRGVSKLSFALNYAVGGLYLPGFHLVNILIHAATASLLYFILKRLFRDSKLFPFLGALLFAVHPVQTHAVTYIVQRMTSLSGLFFLLSIYMYILYRETGISDNNIIGARRNFFWVTAFLSGVLAVFSKEIAVVLPIALCLFDLYFFRSFSKGWRKWLLPTLPFFIVSCLVTFFLFLAPLLKGAGIDAITSTAVTIVSSKNLTPYTYFVTQLEVIWRYIRIIILPYGLTLDYCYPVVSNFFSLHSIISGVGLAGLLLLSWRLRSSNPRISFGISWFFLTLAVESSFIPLDPLFIHRLYLPIVGIIIIALDLLSRFSKRRYVMFFIYFIIFIYAAVTWQRNSLWLDPVAFYEDNLSKAPHSERVRNLLAEQYTFNGREDDAKRLLLEAIRINPGFGSSIVGLSNIYLNEGRRGEAFELLENGLRYNQSDHEIHNSLGSLYSMIGRKGMAEYHLQKAIDIKPDYGKAFCNMGSHYTGLGMWKEAEKQYRIALNLSPNDPMIHYNLGLALLNNGQHESARDEFDQVLKLDPKDKNLIYNLALVWIRLDNRQATEKLLSKLIVVDKQMADKLSSEMKRRK
jgi:tetratricopeptide (TPR) repeat protein